MYGRDSRELEAGLRDPSPPRQRVEPRRLGARGPGAKAGTSEGENPSERQMGVG